LAYLREQGYAVATVERWLPYGNVRSDAFGFGDLLACKVHERIALVQTTTASNMMARYHKILSLPEAETWLRAGGAIFLHGWAKRGARGKRKLWGVDAREITLLEILAQRDELLAPAVLP